MSLDMKSFGKHRVKGGWEEGIELGCVLSVHWVHGFVYVNNGPGLEIHYVHKKGNVFARYTSSQAI